MVHIIDFLKRELDKGNYIGMVLLDFQKAFDCRPQKNGSSRTSELCHRMVSVEFV